TVFFRQVVEIGVKASGHQFFGSPDVNLQEKSRRLFESGALRNVTELRHNRIAVLSSFYVFGTDRVDVFELCAIESCWLWNDVHAASMQKTRAEFVNLS